ncbi:ABC transporter permease subunit [Paenibacillus qinlingensis]|uniref:Aldouronate transport system permease protein n=1 Tax=Paenibacillus qinlingensis TaxID=1837343 RepID=A0ABU1NNY1_9BACL|nr:ABC transporter permease subunit [Paenibacillus qinlingensis]MDR6549185.1 putative aldouronate transport system permease protein [Paenibacillus qinlingensis]
MSWLVNDYRKHKYLYVMIFPVVLFYLIFHYVPMYGAIIAFKNYRIADGFLHSPWVGFDHFISFFQSYYFWRLLKNTLLLNVYMLLISFPAPIIFALLINEIVSKRFKKLVQTITYLPHFISLIVVCGMITQFLARDGFITDILVWFGMERQVLLAHPEYFRSIYIISDIWQGVGWGSIVYLAAITGINPELYEASRIDGANRWKQILNVTIPGMMPIIIILFILKVGHMLDVGFEKIILLYNPNTYVTADMISTFVYRKGLQGSFEFSYATAIGLFQAAINFILLITANRISRKVSENSLW